MKLVISALLSLLFGITSVHSARILGFVPTPSYSHQIVFHPLWKELSLRGHQVTVVTTDPINDKSLLNLTEIDVSFSYKTWNRLFNMNEFANANLMTVIDCVIKVGENVLGEQLEHPAVQSLLNDNRNGFDLVLAESLYPAVAALSEKFNCSLIQIISLEGVGTIYHSVGNPSHPVLNPERLFTYKRHPNFLERLKYVLGYLFVNIYFYPRIVDAQQGLVNKYLGENYPMLQDTLSKTSMLFINSDTVFHTLRPLLPNVIQIGGGTHLVPPKPLPKDLQTLLDSAKNGFIYFSLGSNVKSKFLSDDTRKVLLETFSELPYTIVWKFEDEELSGKPENVIISKWYPQQDVLRHANIKLFITQGGLQSTEEAIYNHIPMIGMPFVGDQFSNVQGIVDKGMGLYLNYNALNKNTFKETILEVINNPKYRNRVKELAELAKDQPMSGLERAVWWTEYVIRHKGVKHLRSPALDLPSYQYFLLDVIGFCVMVILIVVYVIFRLLKFIYNIRLYFVSKKKTKVQ